MMLVSRLSCREGSLIAAFVHSFIHQASWNVMTKVENLGRLNNPAAR